MALKASILSIVMKKLVFTFFCENWSTKKKAAKQGVGLCEKLSCLTCLITRHYSYIAQILDYLHVLL